MPWKPHGMMKSYRYQTCIQHFWDAYLDHIFPKFVFKDQTKTLEHGSNHSRKPELEVQSAQLKLELQSMKPEVWPMKPKSSSALAPTPTTLWFWGVNGGGRGVMLVEKNNLGSCT
jgi:hypothetical protein